MHSLHRARPFVLLTLLALLSTRTAIPCSGIHCFQNGVALAGNNEDFWNPDTKMWFVPAEKGTFGRVYFGFANLFPQGGMNEQGLFFDGFATAELKVTTTSDRPPFSGNLIDEAMAKCGTVDEVVALFESHNLEFLSHAMLMFGDRLGASVVIEGDQLLRKEGRDQILTNFYKSKTPKGGITCPRYLAMEKLLGKTKTVTIDTIRRALKASHQEGRAPTQYSNIYDLTNGIVYLYLFHDFDEVVKIDLADSLQDGARVVDIASLFPKNRSYDTYRKKCEQKIVDYRSEHLGKIDPEDLVDFTGRYSLSMRGRTLTIDVSVEGSELRMAVLEAPSAKEASRLLPDREANRFFHVDFDGATVITFSRAPEGEVTGVEIQPPLGPHGVGWRTGPVPDRERPDVSARKITVGDTVVHVRESGPKDELPVLLLHGARFHSGTWEELGTLEELGAAGFYAVAVDLPGYGSSERAQVDRSTFLEDLLSSLKLDRPAVVFPSMSGSFAGPLLRRHPEILGAAIPVAPVGTPELIQGGNLPLPALVVWGEKDTTFSVDQAAPLADRFSPGQTLILDEARHPAYLDQPDAFHEGLIAFLRSLGRKHP